MSSAWEDITALMDSTAATLGPHNPMAHEASYDVDVVMNVTVMMDPRLDPGATKMELPPVTYLLEHGYLPAVGAFTPEGVSCVLDRGLQCLVSWMRGSSMPQSLMGCLWAHPTLMATLTVACGVPGLWVPSGPPAGILGGWKATPLPPLGPQATPLPLHSLPRLLAATKLASLLALLKYAGIGHETVLGEQVMDGDDENYWRVLHNVDCAWGIKAESVLEYVAGVEAALSAALSTTTTAAATTGSAPPLSLPETWGLLNPAQVEAALAHGNSLLLPTTTTPMEVTDQVRVGLRALLHRVTLFRTMLCKTMLISPGTAATPRAALPTSPPLRWGKTFPLQRIHAATGACEGALRAMWESSLLCDPEVDGQEEVPKDPNDPPRSNLLTRAVVAAATIVDQAATAASVGRGGGSGGGGAAAALIPTSFCPTYEAPFLGSHKPRIVPLLPWPGTVLAFLRHLTGVGFLASLRAMASHDSHPSYPLPQKVSLGGGAKPVGKEAAALAVRRNITLNIVSTALDATINLASHALPKVTKEGLKGILSGPKMLLPFVAPSGLEDPPLSFTPMPPHSKGVLKAQAAAAAAAAAASAASAATAAGSEGAVVAAPAPTTPPPSPRPHLSLLTLWTLLEEFSHTSSDILVRSWLHAMLVSNPKPSVLELVRAELPPLPQRTHLHQVQSLTTAAAATAAAASATPAATTPTTPTPTPTPSQPSVEDTSSQDFNALYSSHLSPVILGTHTVHELALSHLMECGLPGELLWSLEGRRFVNLVVIVLSCAIPGLCTSRQRLGIRLKYVLRDWSVIVEEAAKLDGVWMNYLESRFSSAMAAAVAAAAAGGGTASASTATGSSTSGIGPTPLTREDRRHFRFLAFHSSIHRLGIWATEWSSRLQRQWVSCAWSNCLFSRSEWSAAVMQEDLLITSGLNSFDSVSRARVLGEWSRLWAGGSGGVTGNTTGGLDLVRVISGVSSKDWVGEGGGVWGHSLVAVLHINSAAIRAAAAANAAAATATASEGGSGGLVGGVGATSSVAVVGGGKKKGKGGKGGGGGSGGGGGGGGSTTLDDIEMEIAGWKKEDEDTSVALKIFTARLAASTPIQQVVRCKLWYLKAVSRLLYVSRCTGLWKGLEDEADRGEISLPVREDATLVNSPTYLTSPIFRNPRNTYNNRFRELHSVLSPYPLTYDAFIKASSLPDTPEGKQDSVAPLCKDALAYFNNSVKTLERVMDACTVSGGGKIELNPQTPPLLFPVVTLKGVGGAGMGGEDKLLIDPPPHSLSLLLSARVAGGARVVYKACEKSAQCITLISTPSGSEDVNIDEEGARHHGLVTLTVTSSANLD